MNVVDDGTEKSDDEETIVGKKRILEDVVQSLGIITYAQMVILFDILWMSWRVAERKRWRGWER